MQVAAEVREAVNCLLVDPQQRQVVVTWAGVLRAAAGAGDVEQVVALLREMVDMDQE
jgi:pentatricopeptide repeat protein